MRPIPLDPAFAFKRMLGLFFIHTRLDFSVILDMEMTRNKFIVILVVLLILAGVVFFVPTIFIRLGDKALAAREGDAAGQYFSIAQVLNPWRKDLFEKRGQAEYWQGNFEKALAFYEKAGRAGAASRNYYWWLGTIQFAGGNYEEALVAYEKSGMRETRTARELNSLAATYLALGRNSDAKLFSAKAIAKAGREGDQHTQAKAFNNLGLVYARTGDPGRGEALVKKAISIWEAAGFYDSLGEVYERKDDTKRAIEAYEMFLARARNSSSPAIVTQISVVERKLVSLRKKIEF